MLSTIAWVPRGAAKERPDLYDDSEASEMMARISMDPAADSGDAGGAGGDNSSDSEDSGDVTMHGTEEQSVEDKYNLKVGRSRVWV